MKANSDVPFTLAGRFLAGIKVITHDIVVKHLSR